MTNPVYARKPSPPPARAARPVPAVEEYARRAIPPGVRVMALEEYGRRAHGGGRAMTLGEYARRAYAASARCE